MTDKAENGAAPLVEVRDIVKHFGSVVALGGVSLSVNKGQAKINQASLIVINQKDVRRFNITVNDSVIVSILQCVRDLSDHFRGVGKRERLILKKGFERFSLHILGN